MAETIEQLLCRHEGIVLFPYKDTVGKITIGVGHNLTDVGISKDEAMFLLRKDIALCEKDLDHKLNWWRSLSQPRRNVLISLCFNLGIGGLLRFKKTLKACASGDYALAATEMLDSKWAKQVGNRAVELSEMMRVG